MELIYKNNYGASYKILNAPNADCKLQLIVDSIGIFMTFNDLDKLLNVVRNADEPCDCPDCKGGPREKIWYTNPLLDVCLKVDDVILTQIEDLIVGTKFILNMNDTLQQYRIN
ncbi:hypothetical protein GTQ40_10170 [Flavobacteriaceae bacterium R38]|nr:hypothetical protein [Flavobacteriaceae bacterium R38]